MSLERKKQIVHPVLNDLQNSTGNFLCPTVSCADGKKHPSKRHFINDSKISELDKSRLEQKATAAAQRIQAEIPKLVNRKKDRILRKTDLLIEGCRDSANRFKTSLSIQPAKHGLSAEWIRAPSERRAAERFPMELRLRYQTRWPDLLGIVGRGNTVDISSKGVLFTANKTIRLGTKMQLVVDWPAKLQGEAPLELVMYGTVVRSQCRNVPLIALSVARYSFRTSE